MLKRALPATAMVLMTAVAIGAQTPAKAPAPSAERVTVYCDAGADAAADVVEAVRDSGLSMTTQDYMTAPPSADQLKRLSQMVSASGASVVCRVRTPFSISRFNKSRVPPSS